MSLSSAPTRRHFLPWDRPWLPQVVAWLARDWDEAGPLDLSGAMVVVPTRQSGRRLREALAARADVRHLAVFSPRVLTPDALVGPAAGDDVASALEALLAWTGVFRDANLDTLRAVFPVEPADRSFSWALRLGQMFMRVQATLAESGLRLSDVPERAGADFVEGERWREIAELGRLHAARLAELGRREPQAARIAEAANPPLEPQFSRHILLGVPDPQPLALERLAAMAAGRPIDVVLFAPASEADRFDAWGRPIASAWEQRTIALGDFERRVHLCADPSAQAERLASLAAGYSSPSGRLALGIADPEVTPLLENALARADRPAFNPDGKLRRRGGFHELLACLAELSREPSFGAVEALARCPDFLAYLRDGEAGNFSAARWLAGLDELRTRHLPADLSAAIGFARAWDSRPEVARGLEAMERLRVRLTRGTFSAGTADVLAELFGRRQLNLGDAADVRWQESAVAWTGLLRECAEGERRFPTVTTPEWWDLALRFFGDQSETEDKAAGALELQGWLELLWEDAPHLAVAGLNDGRVPEAVTEDAFLPADLRRRLGLKTNEARFARDAYYLQAIVASRREHGRVDLLVGKTTAAGEPLRPSRLLLRCPDAELPGRIAFLFRAPAPGEAGLAWTRAWKLAPRIVAPPERVAVTALRRYLSCPFRFFLRSVLRMDSVDPLKSELDAFDFGTLCHAALEQIGADPGLRDCTDPETLKAELLHRLDAAVSDRYGRLLSLPLLVQVESARQRLGRLAELQAAERAAGWQIVEVERPFEVTVAGLVVRGKIDRIDRHADTGDVRVLDYKTSDTPVTPGEAHLRMVRTGEEVREWARVDVAGKMRVWSDLQLPMYLRAIGAAYGAHLRCGYFNLPKAAGETALTLWEDYTPELHEAALRCAEGVCSAIRRGEYWPPNETMRAERDEYAALFHHGVGASVEWPVR